MAQVSERGQSSAGTVGSLRRGLEILDMFTAERESIGIGEMALHLDIHKSSASRLASTLAQMGYLRSSSAQGVYRLGARLSALGALASRQLDLVETVLPHLQLLTNLTGETGHLAVLDGPLAKTIAITDGWHTVRMHTYVGKTNFAYCSSMGKALLAACEEEAVREMYPEGSFQPRTDKTIATIDALVENLKWIHDHGYAIDDEELEIGLRCVAAPIYLPDGSVPVSISISGPSQRITPDRIEPVRALVQWAAWQASLALGTTRVPDGVAQPEAERPPLLSWVDPEAIPETPAYR
ncbi:IclR family transcriptional regulator [Leucobacter celer]|uniref:IclR family transcriptional regulator n=1 Tax=Leucobacter celer TaxID=668625 RepID=UPI0006A7EB76|nr:IclR family transcriptional regulator [Leucobacter celer]